MLKNLRSQIVNQEVQRSHWSTRLLTYWQLLSLYITTETTKQILIAKTNPI
ncbi:hypothetical protein [Nostoc sp.]|uniref:hypothetical protein n=1 Tax=Nostoc sp. TaxID=1180 RepID=UPI002FF565A8